MSHTVKFRTFGCKLNQAETAGLAEAFQNAGYVVVADDQPADVSVLNTCTVTGRSSAKCRQAIRQMLKERPDTTVVVTGCYAQVEAETLAQIEGVDYLFGSQDKFALLEHFPGPGKLARPEIHVTPMQEATTAIGSVGDFQAQTRAFLKIQDGCEHGCSYCIVPITRGPCRSVAENEVVAQANALIQKGFREIVLTGVHVGDYGKERQGRTELAGLLRRLLDETPVQRLRLSSLNCEDITDELLDLFVAEPPRLCRHFHIPLQSGQDDVLKAMNRHYTTAEFRATVDKVLSRLGRVGLGSDVIVGFPGETDAQFEQTLRFVESIPFTYLHVFPYSLRPGTVAETMPNHVPAPVKTSRAEQLRAVGKAQKRRFMQGFIGETVPVLLEGSVQNGRMAGWTSEYVRVSVVHDAALENQIVPVRLEKRMGEVLWGRVVS